MNVKRLVASAARPRVSPPTRWLLLRGLGREQRHWFDFPAALSAELGVPVHALDLPGTGERRGEPAPCTIEGTAEDVRRWLSRREPRGVWGVLGISLGGMVALSLAGSSAASISHVVVINSSARCSFAHQRLRPLALARLARAALTRDLEERERRIYALTTNAPEQRVSAWAQRAAALSKERPARASVLARQLWAAAFFRARPVTQPTLVLGSGGDRLVAPACSRALAREIGATHSSHPAAGHDLTLEDPEWVIAQIRAWL